jgi:hypothetical protein
MIQHGASLSPTNHGATRVPDTDVRPDCRFESLAAMAKAHRAG